MGYIEIIRNEKGKTFQQNHGNCAYKLLIPSDCRGPDEFNFA